ncbi:MAG TPA: hypothetical protein VME46_23675 [Acidimicrobiales bacterium]|nr:hypothetical protein [Acidimicrobiales bacterium]
MSFRRRAAGAGAALVIAGAVIAPTAAAAAPLARTTTVAGPLTCLSYGVAQTAPVVYRFSRSTDVADIDYVSAQCMTITITGGPSNPNPTSRSMGSVTYVDLDGGTQYWLGTKASTHAALTEGYQLLSLTVVGKYTVLRALKVQVLPKADKLPK